jgi:hypothetical protein
MVIPGITIDVHLDRIQIRCRLMLCNGRELSNFLDMIALSLDASCTNTNLELFEAFKDLTDTHLHGPSKINILFPIKFVPHFTCSSFGFYLVAYTEKEIYKETD